MKNKLILSCVVMLAACGLNEDKFGEQFGEKLCEEYATCNPDIECATGDDDDAGGECDFDKAAAKACLDGTYTCNDEFGEGFEFVEVPSECANVCGSVTGTTGTTTTTTTTTTTGT